MIKIHILDQNSSCGLMIKLFPNTILCKMFHTCEDLLSVHTFQMKST